ncbi:MAG: hypothetical protein U0996_22120 [Planctomycetaceae bacterium]
MTVTVFGRLFALGQIVITRHAQNVLTNRDLNEALIRHLEGDWGQVCESDRQLNDSAIRNGGRIMSEYCSSSGVRFWIITEYDRSVTTILLPCDY